MPGKRNKHDNDNHRGRGASGGQGRGRGRGRGRGGNPTTISPATGLSTSRPPRRPQYPHPSVNIDVEVQQWAEPGPDVAAGGRNGNGNVNGIPNRGPRPWRGGTPKSRSGSGTPSRGRGRGRGRGWDPDYNGQDASRRPRFGVGAKTRAMATLGKDAPLSALLNSERPLLRPVKFVPAKLTPFLFQRSEDVLNPAADLADTTETSHVPTADRVARLFQANASDSDSESEDRPEDALEEVDFADLAQVRAEIDAIVQGSVTMNQDVHDVPEDIEEVDFADLAAIRARVDATKPQAACRDDVPEEVFTGVYSHVRDVTQVSRAMGDVTSVHSLAIKPSIDIPDESNLESPPQAQDRIIIEDEVPSTPNRLSGISTEEQPSPSIASETHTPSVILSPPPDTLEEEADRHPLFVIDTTPSQPFWHRSASDVILVDRAGHGDNLGDRDHDEDEERIVYVAPHPRSGRASPVPAIPRVKLPSTSILTGKPVIVEEGGLTDPVAIREDEDEGGNRKSTIVEDPPLSLAALSLGPAASPSPPAQKAVLRAHKKEAGLRRKRQQRHKRARVGFSAIGAKLAEAQLMEDVWETRRRGGSDLDWGTEDEGEGEGGDEDEDAGGVDALSNSLGGMEIDPDLGLDANAMRGFLKSMSAEGSRFVTMDDIEDEARMRREDEEGLGGPEGSSDSDGSGDEAVGEVDDEEEEVFDMEEKMLIAESEGEEELSPDSDDDELSPRTNFQARLRKVRERSHQHLNTFQEISDDEEEEEELVARLNGYLNARGVEALLDDFEFTTPVQKKDKGKQLTGEFGPELKAQWAKDRTKKAERKREREAARKREELLGAGNGKGKGKWEGSGPGKSKRNGDGNGNGKGKGKSKDTGAQLDPTAVLEIVPKTIVDVNSLEAEMRRLVEEVRGVKTAGDGLTSVIMELPPMNKGMRKMVHEMAAMFGVKSVSHGDGRARHTTLIGTSRTGLGVKEGKVMAMMKRYGGLARSGGGKDGSGKGGGGKEGGIPKHREGEVVGKGAPKIGEHNIGFRMLASMGWSEGDRIGGTASVGIEAPLTAIIKNSKLGLGATR